MFEKVCGFREVGGHVVAERMSLFFSLCCTVAFSMLTYL